MQQIENTENKQFAKILGGVFTFIFIAALLLITSCTKSEPKGQCQCVDIRDKYEAYNGNITQVQCKDQEKELQRNNDNYVCYFR